MDREGLHPSDKDLLSFADGELGKRQAARIERHLTSCWGCRARQAQIEDAITQFVTLRRKLLDYRLQSPSFPSEHASRARLRIRLAETAAARPLWRSAIVGPAWAVGPLLALLLVLLLVQPLLVPRLSAMDVIANGQAAEARLALGGVTHQRLRIHSRQASTGISNLEYDVWRKTGRSRILLAAGTSDAVERLRALYHSRGAEWESPVSVTTFARLRDSLGPVRDEVRGTDQITVTSTALTEAGEIKRLALTVRRSDWRALSQHIELRDAEFELTKVLDEEVPRDKVDPAIFQETLPPPPSTPVLRAMRGGLSPVPAVPSGPTREQLDTSEIQLREALHQTWADVEEVPEIWRQPDRIRFRLFAQSRHRKEEILAALNDIPYLAPEVSDAESMPADSSQPGVRSKPQPQLFSTHPPLAKALREYSGGLEPANTLLNAARDSYLEVLVEGSALERLAGRYSDAEWDRLPADSQKRLNRIAADHIAAVRTKLTNYLRLVSPVLDEMAASQQVDMPLPDEGGEAGCTSWRTAAPLLVEELRAFGTAFRRLFMEERTEAPVTVSAPELLSQSLRLRIRLQQQLCQP